MTPMTRSSIAEHFPSRCPLNKQNAYFFRVGFTPCASMGCRLSFTYVTTRSQSPVVLQVMVPIVTFLWYSSTGILCNDLKTLRSRRRQNNHLVPNNARFRCSMRRGTMNFSAPIDMVSTNLDTYDYFNPWHCSLTMMFVDDACFNQAIYFAKPVSSTPGGCPNQIWVSDGCRTAVETAEGSNMLDDL